MEFSIRSAGAADARVLADLRLRSNLERHGGDPGAFGPYLEECVRVFEAGLDAGTLRAWLAYDGERAVGTATLAVLPTLPRFGRRLQAGRPHDGRIRNVHVEPEYRRRGIASALVRAAIAEAERLGLDRLALGTSVMGRPLYERLGFIVKDDELKYPLRQA